MPWLLASILALSGSGVIIFSFTKNKRRATETQLNLELFTYEVFLHVYFLATVSRRNLSLAEVRKNSVIQTYPCLLRSDSVHCFMGNTILHYVSTLR